MFQSFFQYWFVLSTGITALPFILHNSINDLGLFTCDASTRDSPGSGTTVAFCIWIWRFPLIVVTHIQQQEGDVLDRETIQWKWLQNTIGACSSRKEENWEGTTGSARQWNEKTAIFGVISISHKCLCKVSAVFLCRRTCFLEETHDVQMTYKFESTVFGKVDSKLHVFPPFLYVVQNRHHSQILQHRMHYIADDS